MKVNSKSGSIQHINCLYIFLNSSVLKSSPSSAKMVDFLTHYKYADL